MRRTGIEEAAPSALSSIDITCTRSTRASPLPQNNKENQRTTKCPIRLLSIFSFYFFSLSKAFPPWVFRAPNKPNQDPLWVNESSFSDPVHDLKLFVRHTPTNQYTTLLFRFLVFIRGCCLLRPPHLPRPPFPPSPIPLPPARCRWQTGGRSKGRTKPKRCDTRNLDRTTGRIRSRTKGRATFATGTLGRHRQCVSSTSETNLCTKYQITSPASVPPFNQYTRGATICSTLPHRVRGTW